MLKQITVLKATSAQFPLEALEQMRDIVETLLDTATQGTPVWVLRVLDSMSHWWMKRVLSADELAEAECIYERLNKRPGIFYLCVNYEWGCTVGAFNDATLQNTPTVTRTLDWFIKGLGEYLIAVLVPSRMGAYVVLTWPGYPGVLQVCAKGGFSVAINQAPYHQCSRLVPQWVCGLVNFVRIMRSRNRPATYLLREACEKANSFGEMVAFLKQHKPASPVIYTMGGVHPGEHAVIEWGVHTVAVREHDTYAANHWVTLDEPARESLENSVARREKLMSMTLSFDMPFDEVLVWPVRTAKSVMACFMNAAEGRVRAVGLEAGEPVTVTLDLRFTARGDIVVGA